LPDRCDPVAVTLDRVLWSDEHSARRRGRRSFGSPPSSLLPERVSSLAISRRRTSRGTEARDLSGGRPGFNLRATGILTLSRRPATTPTNPFRVQTHVAVDRQASITCHNRATRRRLEVRESLPSLRLRHPKATKSGARLLHLSLVLQRAGEGPGSCCGDLGPRACTDREVVSGRRLLRAAGRGRIRVTDSAPA
jgi:hypothetical protein